MKHGLAGLVLIRKVDGLVLARREGDVAQPLAPARALAFDMDHKSGALALLAQNGAQAEHRVDVARRDLHAWGECKGGPRMQQQIAGASHCGLALLHKPYPPIVF